MAENGLTPARRGVLTPKTAVLSPLTFTPAVGRGASKPEPAAASAELGSAAQWKHIANELDTALQQVLQDSREYTSLLDEETSRAKALEKELDATKSAHQDLSALLHKSMEREKASAKKVESVKAEIEEWKVKYHKLYQDAKTKLGLSAEKIEHYRSQLREGEGKDSDVAGKMARLEQEVSRLRSEAEGGAKGRASAEELARTQNALRQQQLEAQKSQGEVLELQAKVLELEEQVKRLKLENKRVGSGNSGSAALPRESGSRVSTSGVAISPWKKSKA